MGVYYIIVNDSKGEFIDPFDFNEDVKLAGLLGGVHGSAVRDLLVFTDSIPKDRQLGRWSGDKIRIHGDHFGPERAEIFQNYQNISFELMAYLYEMYAYHRAEIEQTLKEDQRIRTKLLGILNPEIHVNLAYKLRLLGLIGP
ncbi:MAG: hypothetical protein AAF206_18445 [Bacteroidota bacterium]